MSFMEGFANAVSENIVDKRKRKRDMEDDVFRANYNRYLTGLDDKKKQAESEKQAFTQADYLTKRYNLDAQATKVLAKALASGVGMEQLKEDLEKGTMEFGTPAQPSGPTTPAPSVNQEMQSSGLDPKEYVEEETPVNAIETGRTPIAAAAMPEEDKRRTAAQEKSVQRIAEMTGDDEESVREAMFGKSQQDLSPSLSWSFKPKNNADREWMEKFPLDDLDKAKAEVIKLRAMGNNEKADQAEEMISRFTQDRNVPDVQGFMLSKDEKTGRPVYIKGKTMNGYFHKFENGKYEEQGTPLNVFDGQMISNDSMLEPKDQIRIIDEVKPFQDQKRAALENIKLSKEAMTIVSQTGGQALTQTAGLVSNIQGLSNELSAVQNLIRSTAAAGDTEGAITTGIESIKNMFKNIEESGINTDAKRLFKIQLDMVYSQLKSYGESGNSISNLDINNVMMSVFDNKPENFAKHLMKQMNNNVSNLESNRTAIMENSGSLIIQSKAHEFMNESVQNQILNLTRDEERGEIEEFMRQAKVLDDTNYRVMEKAGPQRSETMQVPPQTESNGMQLVGQSPDGQFLIYQDANGNKFRRKK